MSLDLSFILVEPAVPQNIGAAARALNTMGFEKLILVNPGDYLSKKARMLAHGSNHILESAKVYPTLKDCIDEFSFVIATSAKARSVKNDVYNIKEANEILKEKGSTISNVALVFGREESGLTNEEIQICDLVTSIPLKNPYPSLNLGQAVMLYAYEINNLSNFALSTEAGTPDGKSFRKLRKKIEDLLVNLEIAKNPALFHRILERISLLSEKDIHLFHSVIDRIDNNYNSGD